MVVGVIRCRTKKLLAAFGEREVVASSPPYLRASSLDMPRRGDQHLDSDKGGDNDNQEEEVSKSPSAMSTTAVKRTEASDTPLEWSAGRKITGCVPLWRSATTIPRPSRSLQRSAQRVDGNTART